VADRRRCAGGPIQLLDVHLRPPMSDDGSWVKGYFTTRPDREREAVAYVASSIRRCRRSSPATSTRKTNGLAMAVFGTHGFADALSKFHPGALTWHWPVGAMTLRFRLDHVLADARFRVVDAAVVDGGRSDHQPVWADVERVTTSSPAAASAPTGRSR